MKLFELPDHLAETLFKVESSENQAEREDAIHSLTETNDVDVARALMEIYRFSMWRSTKFKIIEHISDIHHPRVVEFLIHIASDESDFSLAKAAIRSLSKTSHPLAFHYLRHQCHRRENPLQMDAIRSLTNHTEFPLLPTLKSILEQAIADNLNVPHIVLAAGSLGHTGLRDVLHQLIISSENERDLHAPLVALANVGDESSIPHILKYARPHGVEIEHLANLVIQRIETRLQSTIEDLLLSLGSATSSRQKAETIRLLSQYPWDDVKSCLELLETPLTPDELALLYSHKCAELSEDEISTFVNTHLSEVSPTRFHSFCYALSQFHASWLKSWLSTNKDPGQRVAVHGATFAQCDATTTLEALENLEGDAFFQAVNHLVDFSLSSLGNDDAVQSLSQSLISLIQKGKLQPAAHQRLVRAVGQIGWCDANTVKVLSERLANDTDRNSCYYALGLLGTEACANAIMKRLKKIRSKDESRAEIKMVLSSLALCQTENTDLSPIASVEDKESDDNLRSILFLLTRVPREEFSQTVATGLASENFQVKMLAIAAAKGIKSPKISKCLIELLDHKNSCYRIRSLDSLCFDPNESTLKAIFKWLASEEQEELHLKVLRTIPSQGLEKEKRSILTAYNTSGIKEHFSDEVREACGRLLDSLGGSDPAPTTNPSISNDPLEQKLSQELSGYESWESNVKSVIRNAEITYANPNLFDETVDKSTILVEYVKSIDLILQQKVGKRVFSNSGGSFFSQMQSRIVALNIDGLSGAQLLKQLQCEQQFSVEAFPAHKMGLLCDAISNGRILRDPLRHLDGLRAWSILFLLFGRQFKKGGRLFVPILPIQDGNNRTISELAASLNTLQNIRNAAAHHGTMAKFDDLTNLRTRCFDALNTLHDKVLL